MNALIRIGCLLALLPWLNARETATPVTGLHTHTPRVHALVGATVVTSPKRTLENATIVIRNGLIESVGVNTDIPSDARVWDLKGKTIYPGFIDAYSHYGMPAGLKPAKPRDPYADSPPPPRPPLPKQMGPSYWNPLVTPERDATLAYNAKAKDAESLNDLGFTTVAAFPGRGIFRGQGLLVNVNRKPVNESSVKTKIAQHIAFETAPRDPSTSSAPYPGSLMGSIALIRQALYDAKWHEEISDAYEQYPQELERPIENAALSELKPLVQKKQLGLFQATDELDYQRIHKIAEEFSVDFAIIGNGYEYRRSKILSDSGATVILPLAFPKAPFVTNYHQSLDVSLERLQHWEFAPSNAALLSENNIPFCITSHTLANPSKDFWNRLRTAVQRGLSESKALEAISIAPAKLYNVEDRLGTIQSGKIANLVIATRNLFSDEKARISAVWVDGEYYEKKAARAMDLEGEWSFVWKGVAGFPNAKIVDAAGKFTLQVDELKAPLTVSEKEVRFLVNEAALGIENSESIARLQGFSDTTSLSGTGSLGNGQAFSWSAERVSESNTIEKEKEKKELDIPELVFDQYPAGAFGVRETVQPDSLLVTNATLWTNGPDGVIEETDILFKKGKIAKIGKNLKGPKGTQIVDATGKHVTPGLIDCHSHTAMSRGVNETGSAISVEVRVADIVNPVDINIYRQLAGGLTTANLLHGSANPMGGQSQVVKLRWGEDANAFPFEGARPGVKFALGENVKQSNWGDRFTTRYPQTRMGVEQFMESYFRAAEDYQQKWEDYEGGKTKTPPRKNIRLDATLEILRGDRDVHIHSYRQDEILMFARLAQRLGIRVAAFQHILEGYKVADAMVDINAGGSTFSDWWAYKFEVYDAIPYNGAMMHKAGVLTSFNSDDAELATRMNTEAAKAVKYGGLTEEEALKFVTLNPAIQLGIEDRVGSLEVGKDADFVIWNDHPLSTFASADQTWVDGIKRFDKTDHEKKVQSDKLERDALVQKALLLQAKLPKSKSEKLEADSESESGEPDHESHEHSEIDWIYLDGTHHYSCSGLEEEGH